ncbi:MAG: DUF4292 domain-containing protein [Candidatus Pedobacter colombiensis]|uniref:DUF4292 domain-containing protein n=1 Tax=Candidatus Pedobacter colombiensis TaxID=3121371 RepID=A0AAJ6B7C0_9SPHI|nr:DUF4292 domain-containing protein [Pedobacter sp.]WEK19729.1 MAG: DUF4292 domain-containing protein [Pedobacter sp.]
MSGNIWNNLLWAGLLSATLLACKIKKAVVVASPPAIVKELSSENAENIQLLKSKDLVFSTLSVKAKAKLDLGGSKNNATMNIRMEKGRRIWVSITALAGIEVARALITPDSIKVRNNFQNVYLKQPFDYIHKFTNEQVSFDWLESILSGNTIPYFFNDEAKIEQLNGQWILQGEKEALVYKVLFDGVMKVSESTVNDVTAGQALKVLYSGAYQDLGGSLFPSGLTINSMTGNKIVNIELEYYNVERNVPLDFPFSVPGKYEVIN